MFFKTSFSLSPLLLLLCLRSSLSPASPPRLVPSLLVVEEPPRLFVQDEPLGVFIGWHTIFLSTSDLIRSSNWMLVFWNRSDPIIQDRPIRSDPIGWLDRFGSIHWMNPLVIRWMDPIHPIFKIFTYMLVYNYLFLI